MDDNKNDDLRRRMETQEQTFRTQQEALDNIQRMLTQLLTNRNNENSENHDWEEENKTPEDSNTRSHPQLMPRS